VQLVGNLTDKITNRYVMWIFLHLNGKL